MILCFFFFKQLKLHLASVYIWDRPWKGSSEISHCKILPKMLVKYCIPDHKLRGVVNFPAEPKETHVVLVVLLHACKRVAFPSHWS